MIKQILLNELIKTFKGTKLEENNNIATNLVRTMFAYFQIINLRILKWLI